MAEQATSGQTVAAFCVGRGIAASTFFAKRRALARPAVDAVDAAFVEVLAAGHDRQRPGQRPAGSPASAESAALELVLACGAKVVVGEGFDAALLRRVVEVLS